MKKIMFAAVAAFVMTIQSGAQPLLTLQVDKAERTVSPTLYGLMTEEINYSYEGGLYSQLLRDIAMQEMTGGQQGRRQQGGGRQGGPAPKPRYWILNDSTAGTLVAFVSYRSVLSPSNLPNLLRWRIQASGALPSVLQPHTTVRLTLREMVVSLLDCAP